MLSQAGQSMLEQSGQNAEDSDISRGIIIRPNYFINISGEVEAQNYRTTLQGGSKYTVYFEYEKMGYGTAGEDTFTINSVKLRRAITPLTVVETNENGEASAELLFGQYEIKEIQAPDGYILTDETFEINFQRIEEGQDPEEVHTITFENTKKPKVTVHYYKLEEKNSPNPEPLIDDVILIGNPGERYETDIIMNLEKDGNEYELENTILDDGTKTSVVPENWRGEFKLGEDQEVFYYYVEKKTPLIVHHYIQGTEIGVPLADGKPAQDERLSGKEGNSYTTDALTAGELSEEYELVSMPENSTGTYGKDEIVVTYYYKKVNKNVSIFKYALQKQINEETGKEEDVKVPLAGADFTILLKQGTTENLTSLDEEVENQQASRIQIGGLGNTTEVPKYTTDENGKIDVKLEVGEYLITEVKAPEGYILPEGKEAEYELTVNKETEDGQLIGIENKKPQGRVEVYHYQLDNEGNKTETPVLLIDGNEATEDPKIQDIGSIYTTKPVENLPINWKYVESEGETSGIVIDGTIVVKYYYKEVDFEETIDIELTKIWKDNEIQALRRPNRIKFIVTPYIENANQVVVDEKIVSEEYLEDTVNQEQNDIQMAQETINNEIVKETTNEQENSSENIKLPEVNIENVEQETKTDESSNDSIVDESNNSVNTTDDSNNTANIAEKNSSRDTTAESQETTNIIFQAPTDLSNTVTDKNNVQESNLTESDTQQNDTIANNQTEEVTIQELEEMQYYMNVEKGESFTYILEGLPKYDRTTGSVIHYNITESYDDVDGSPDDLKFYTSQGGEVIELIDEITGNIKYTSRIINTFTLPSENTKNIKAVKVWNDRSNERSTRPESIILELVGRVKNITVEEKEDGSKVLNIPETAEKVLDAESEQVDLVNQNTPNQNTYEHTFSKSKYDADGQEIEYSVDEKEKAEGSLNEYSKIITTNEDKSEFTITNTLNIQGSNITKIGTEKLRAIDGKVNYTINYNAELDINYSQDEDIIVTIVDNLPYKISEKERNIAGGVYDENAKTIIWTGTYNTKSEEQVVVWADGSTSEVKVVEANQVKTFEFKRDISFSYVGITLDIETIVNNISGTIELEKSAETVEDNCTTIIDWKKDVIVNKMWVGDTESTRPDSITVQLKQVVEDENGNESFVEIQNERYKNPITIEKTMENEETEWTYTYKNLPRYDADEKEIKYTVVETEVDGYYCEKTEEVKDGNTIITLTNNVYGNITVTKVDSRKEEVKLAGAEFKLERVIKEVNEEGKINWRVPEEGSEDYFVTTGTTGDEGTLKFENLKYGFYKLTETKAPDDYRISKEEIKVIEVNSSDEDHLNAKVTVGNDKKYSLPLTGGYGTNIIRNIGILIISLVAILFTNRKKVVPVKREKASKPKRRK